MATLMNQNDCSQQWNLGDKVECDMSPWWPGYVCHGVIIGFSVSYGHKHSFSMRILRIVKMSPDAKGAPKDVLDRTITRSNASDFKPLPPEWEVIPLPSFDMYKAREEYLRTVTDPECSHA